MKTHTDELRARIARGWPDSGLSQPEYARQHGITERTLRAWRAKYCADRLPFGDGVRKAIEEALAKLQAALDAIDRAAAAGEDAVQKHACEVMGEQREVAGTNILHHVVKAAPVREQAAEAPDDEPESGTGHESAVSASDVSVPRSCAEPLRSPRARGRAHVGARNSYFSEFE